MLNFVSEHSEQQDPAPEPASAGTAADPPAPPPAGHALVPPPAPAAELMLAELASERAAERRTLGRAALAAILFHVLLLIVTFPELRSQALEIKKPSRVHIVPQNRFRPPPPSGPTEAPKKKVKRIPIPDPTPDDPEPIEVPEIELPEIDLPQIDDIVFGIPGPPKGFPGTGDGPLQIGGNVKPPVVISKFKPRYTEEARKARIEGIVLLQTVITERGDVTRVQVVKGLTMGLTESAIETVKQWQYKPATQEGKPVAVYMLMQVRFSLQ